MKRERERKKNEVTGRCNPPGVEREACLGMSSSELWLRKPGIINLLHYNSHHHNYLGRVQQSSSSIAITLCYDVLHACYLSF
jgi:hypothetical protein